MFITNSHNTFEMPWFNWLLPCAKPDIPTAIGMKKLSRWWILPSLAVWWQTPVQILTTNCLSPWWHVCRSMTGTKSMYEWSVGDAISLFYSAKVVITLTIGAIEHAYAHNDHYSQKYSQKHSIAHSIHRISLYLERALQGLIFFTYTSFIGWKRIINGNFFSNLVYWEEMLFPSESNSFSSDEDIKYRYKPWQNS